MRAQHVAIPVYGLSCGGGGMLTVERAVAKLPGVTRVYGNPATEMAYVEFDPALISLERIVAVVEDTGFEVGKPERHVAS